jgi:hypothetical protein
LRLVRLLIAGDLGDRSAGLTACEVRYAREADIRAGVQHVCFMPNAGMVESIELVVRHLLATACIS